MSCFAAHVQIANVIDNLSRAFEHLIFYFMFHSKMSEASGLKEPVGRPSVKPLQRDNSTQARNEGYQSEDDESSSVSRIATGSTVARDLDTTASSGPREFLNLEKDAEAPESQATSVGGAPNISELHNTTENAYGGGLYGSDESTLTITGDRDRWSRGLITEESSNSRASDSQSVDGGPRSLSARREIETPPSSGHRDVDVTGQSYIG